MSTLYVYADPWADFSDVQRQMERFAQRFLGDMPTLIESAEDYPSEAGSRPSEHNKPKEQHNKEPSSHSATAKADTSQRNATASRRPEPSLRSVVPQRWHPRIDVLENENAIVLHAELPGCGREDVKLSVEDNKLVLQGEKRTRREEKGTTWVRRERMEGTFYRALQLPRGVDASQIEASFTDGVLEVVVPKPTQKPPQRHEIEIKTSTGASDSRL